MRYNKHSNQDQFDHIFRVVQKYQRQRKHQDQTGDPVEQYMYKLNAGTTNIPIAIGLIAIMFLLLAKVVTNTLAKFSKT